MTRKRLKNRVQNQQIEWLPIDSRLVPSIFSFGHVRGVARIFLTLEITLTTLVVLGTLALVVLKEFKGL